MFIHLDMHDPGVRPQPGEQRHAPGQHGPGQAVAQLVHGAEGDVRLRHLGFQGQYLVSVLYLGRSDYLGSDRVAVVNDGDWFDEYRAHLGE